MDDGESSFATRFPQTQKVAIMLPPFAVLVLFNKKSAGKTGNAGSSVLRPLFKVATFNWPPQMFSDYFSLG